MPTVCRSLKLPLLSPLPPPFLATLPDYRRLVNEILREALTSGKTARGSMSRFARDRALALQLTGQHAAVAAGLALCLAKAHRRRVRTGRARSESPIPFVRQPFLRADRSTFHFDLGTGKVRLSLRNGVWCSFLLGVAPYHREALTRPGTVVKQLQVSPKGAVLFLDRAVPEPFRPDALLAFDTNESSMDGVSVTPGVNQLVRLPFPEIRALQLRHATRRRRLSRKKATDRRVGRRLLGKEGRREHHRIRSRLHDLTRELVETALARRAAIALEDLTRMPQPRRRPFGRYGGEGVRSSELRRRLSS